MARCVYKARNTTTTRGWKREEGSYLEPRRAHCPADTLISDSWTPEPGWNQVLWFEAPVGATLFRQPWDTPMWVIEHARPAWKTVVLCDPQMLGDAEQFPRSPVWWQHAGEKEPF